VDKNTFLTPDHDPIKAAVPFFFNAVYGHRYVDTGQYGQQE